MKGYFFIAMMVLLTTAGQLLTKKGAVGLAFGSEFPKMIKAFLNPYLIAAMLTILIVPVFYILALKDLELSTAFAFTGLNYVLVSIGGKLIFGEQLNAYHFWGMVFICLGLIIFPL